MVGVPVVTGNLLLGGASGIGSVGYNQGYRREDRSLGEEGVELEERKSIDEGEAVKMNQ